MIVNLMMLDSFNAHPLTADCVILDSKFRTVNNLGRRIVVVDGLWRLV